MWLDVGVVMGWPVPIGGLGGVGVAQRQRSDCCLTVCIRNAQACSFLLAALSHRLASITHSLQFLLHNSFGLNPLGFSFMLGFPLASVPIKSGWEEEPVLEHLAMSQGKHNHSPWDQAWKCSYRSMVLLAGGLRSVGRQQVDPKTNFCYFCDLQGLFLFSSFLLMLISIFQNHLCGFWSSVLLLLVLVHMLSFMLAIRDCPRTDLRMSVGIWRFRRS